MNDLSRDSALKKALFVTYNGMTDQLGQSQVIPYLQGLSEKGYKITILSCEKKDRLEREGDNIRSLLKAANIQWEYILFSNQVPVWSKYKDRKDLFRKAIDLQRRDNFQLIHCRSYIAAEIGAYLKKRFAVKFIFDMRGFWADEKKDSGHWDTQSIIYRSIYNRYKKIERKLLIDADAVVVLTHAAKREILTWNLGSNMEDKVNVIPCCADLDHFAVSSVDPVMKQQLRIDLNLEHAQPVFSYLGSIGNSYAVSEMLEFFSELKKSHPSSRFLIFTRDPISIIEAKIGAFPNITMEDIVVTYVQRKDLPTYLSLCDFSIFFYYDTYSRKACSPTKFAEISGMGIPVVCNAVGDLNQEALAGLPHIVVNSLSSQDIAAGAEDVNGLSNSFNATIRNYVSTDYSLTEGINRYDTIYKKLTD